MGERISDGQVTDLLALLRAEGSIETKVTQITNVKSGIKQSNVPDTCVIGLFEITRIATSSQHAALSHAGFTTLHYLLSRLSTQEPKHITREAARTVPIIVEKIGDYKEKYRVLAAQCLTTFWKFAPLDVERAIRSSAMTGKNSRAKEASMQWLVQMHNHHGLQFKGFVPILMELLEDADGMVRDIARGTVIELFQNAPNAAKSDLKKQLKIFNVRPAIVATITNQLSQSNHVDADISVQEDTLLTSRAHLSNSVSSVSSYGPVSRPVTPVIEAKVEQVEPSYVNTQRELDETFREMQPFFEGKESEHNWLKREQSCTRLRKLNAGNAPIDFRENWLAGIKSLLDGILKAVNSLRTSLSKEGCHVVQEVTKTAGSGMDPMVEILLQNLIKLCGGTKKIASQSGDATVDIIIGKVSYNVRIMQHIWLACQDKNVQPRMYAAGWLKTLLKKEAHHKSHVEHTGGLELAEKCIKKGLADANPGVREKMRGTYWAFALIWHAKAETIMSTLDGTQQKLLENDPNNPNSPKKVEPAVARPGLGFSKSTTTGPPKPSLRETMLAQKKAAMAARNLPARPGSAMSSFSPVKSSSAMSAKSDLNSARQRPESGHGGLSVAPMRPTKVRPRPEIARPATAGPYSVRRPPHATTNTNETSNISPISTSARARSPSGTTSPPKKVAPRPNTSQSNHSHMSHSSPSKEPTASKIPLSPRTSPGAKIVAKNVRIPSPAKDDEEFTMVMPNVNALAVQEVNHSSPPVVTPAKSLTVYEDPFSPTDDHTTPRPAFSVPVLEEVPVNEDAANIVRPNTATDIASKDTAPSPEKLKQNSKLLDSGITRVNSKTLDAHGFRKLQGLIRENKVSWTDDRFDALLLGLFDYLEAPLSSLAPEKVQDVKAQILATINVMLKKDREAFRSHVPKGMKSLLATRSSYDSRVHIVSGLDILASELVALGSPEVTASTITTVLQTQDMSLEGCRTLSMGLRVLKELLDTITSWAPTAVEIGDLAKLAMRCLESTDSRVRMDGTQLCVSLHSRLGDNEFWNTVTGIKDDPKNLVTYYIIKRQKELSIM